MLNRVVSAIFASALLAGGSAPALAESPGPLIEIRIGSTRPPPRVIEVRSSRPSPGFVWVEGAWDWQGDWVWLPGHWEHAERNVYWVRPRYTPEYGQWRYAPGHWSNQRVHEGDDYRRWRDERRKEKRNGRGHGNGKHK